MNQNSTFIILPVYNENPEILRDVLSHFNSYRCVVVDDGSHYNVEETLKASMPTDNIYFYRNKENKGQGSAIEEGVKLAIANGAEAFCTIDGDGQHDPKSCFDIINAFSNNKVDILLGSRFMNSSSSIPFLRKIFLKGAIWVNYFYSGILLSDAHCGIRVFNASFAQKVNFYNHRQAHASEFLWLIKENNFTFKEFPVHIIYTQYSIQKGQSIWNSFLIFFNLIRHRMWLSNFTRKK